MSRLKRFSHDAVLGVRMPRVVFWVHSGRTSSNATVLLRGDPRPSFGSSVALLCAAWGRDPDTLSKISPH